MLRHDALRVRVDEVRAAEGVLPGEGERRVAGLVVGLLGEEVQAVPDEGERRVRAVGRRDAVGCRWVHGELGEAEPVEVALRGL